MARRRDAAFGTSEPSVGEHHGGSFAVYMSHKRAKLAVQLAGDAQGGDTGENDSAALPEGSVFAGVVVYVNGRTDPPFEALRVIVASGGGRVDPYLTSAVTHVVADVLPDSKIKEIRGMRRWMPVVSPRWLTDCASRGRALPVDEYLLPAFRSRGHGLDRFFAAHRSPPPDRSAPDAADVVKPVDDADGAPACGDELADVHGMDAVEDAPTSGEEDGDTESRPLLSVWEPGRHAGNDPMFIDGYFRSSRLHFIGSFRSHVQALVARYQNAQFRASGAVPAGVPVTADVAQRLLSAPRAAGPRVIAHVDIDCFFAQVALLDRPDLAAAPVVVAHGGARPSGTSRRELAFGDGIDTAGSGEKLDVRQPPTEALPRKAQAPQPKYAQTSGGEISSANYPARSFGIYAGMTVGAARELCPELVVLPYDFERIRRVSEAVFRLCLQVTPRVQAVSCDEAYLDLTGIAQPVEAIQQLRRAVLAETRCTVSAGIGPNMLLARLATGKAKPNGMYVIPDDRSRIRSFVAALPVGDLPGMGWSSAARLREAGLITASDVLMAPPAQLQELVGPSKAAALAEFARGDDSRELVFRKPRQTVGVEVNWGVRFRGTAQAHAFLQRLSVELMHRLDMAAQEDAVLTGMEDIQPRPLRAAALTFKMLLRATNAPAPHKFLGHGVCDAVSKTILVEPATACSDVVAARVVDAYESFRPDPRRVRGLGITATRFQSDTTPATGLLALFAPAVVAGDRGVQTDAEFSPRADAMRRPTIRAVAQPPTAELSQFEVPPGASAQKRMPSAGSSAPTDTAAEVVDLLQTQVPTCHVPETPVSVAFSPINLLTQPQIERGRVRTASPAELEHPRDTEDGAPRTLRDPGAAILFSPEPLSATLPVLREWIRSVGARPTPQHAVLLVAYARFLVRRHAQSFGTADAHLHPHCGTLEDAVVLLRAVRRWCVEMRDEAAGVASRILVQHEPQMDRRGLASDLSVMTAWVAPSVRALMVTSHEPTNPARDAYVAGGCAADVATWEDVATAIHDCIQEAAATELGSSAYALPPFPRRVHATP